MSRLNMQAVRESFRFYPDREIGTMQVAIYVAAGGGWIGNMYAHQPAHAYRDMRTGRAPFGSRNLETMRQVLVAMAEEKGLNPNDLPPMPDFHGCGFL